MEQLINIFPAILMAAGESPEVIEVACIAAWNHVAGETLRHHASALRLTHKKLTIAVADTIWQRQLEIMRQPLLARLNSILGQPLVSFIEFRVAPEELKDPKGATGQEGRILGDRPVPLELLRAASMIEDSKLRKAYLGAATSCLHRTEGAQEGKSETS